MLRRYRGTRREGRLRQHFWIESRIPIHLQDRSFCRPGSLSAAHAESRSRTRLDRRFRDAWSSASRRNSPGTFLRSSKIVSVSCPGALLDGARFGQASAMNMRLAKGRTGVIRRPENPCTMRGKHVDNRRGTCAGRCRDRANPDRVGSCVPGDRVSTIAKVFHIQAPGA